MATKSIAWNDGSGDHLLLTYQGSGSGPITVQSDENSGAARSKVITIETVGGAITRNFTVNQEAAPILPGDVKNFLYTGTVQEITLPKGQYKLQCWGAQGGDVTGSYAASGAKGGYSEGVLTFSAATKVYIFVGGQGSSASSSTTGNTVQNGGWNGGGGAPRRCSYDSGDVNGISYPRPGGGASDISTVTSSMSYSNYRNNRSTASLNARLIVAGGGAGASARYTREKVDYITSDKTTAQSVSTTRQVGYWYNGTSYVANQYMQYDSFQVNSGKFYQTSGAWHPAGLAAMYMVYYFNSSGTKIGEEEYQSSSQGTVMSMKVLTIPSGTKTVVINSYTNTSSGRSITVQSFECYDSSSSTSSGSQVGGGTSGGGTNPGTQSSGGGEFGKGANMTATGYRYASGGGGGGYYGGGSSYDDSTTGKINQSGGGSGYIGSLTSAQTKAGNTSFPAPGGGNETGHSGNGYVRITRL